MSSCLSWSLSRSAQEVGINNRIQICKLPHTFGSEIPPLGITSLILISPLLANAFFFWSPTMSSELENTFKRKIEIHFSLFPEGSYRSAGETNHTKRNTQREGNYHAYLQKDPSQLALLHPYCSSHITLQ